MIPSLIPNAQQERLSHPLSISEAVLTRDLLGGETSAFHHRASLR